MRRARCRRLPEIAPARRHLERASRPPGLPLFRGRHTRRSLPRGGHAERCRHRFRRRGGRSPRTLTMTTVNANFSRIPAKAARAKLNQTDWAVLHAIGLHVDKTGGAFPSMARIAEITGIKRPNVARAIGRIERRGLMRRHRVPRPNGGWQVNHYELVYEPLGDVIPSDNTPHVIST